MTQRTRHPSAQQQRGVALAIGLLMLIVLSVIGIAAMTMTVLDETMSGNMRDKELAFQAAEAALRDAEQQIAGMQFACGHVDVAPTTGGSIGATGASGNTVTIWDRDAAALPDPLDDESWASATAYSGSLNGVAAQPRYTVQEMYFDAADNSAVYRITARGVGGTEAARSTVQSYFRKVFDNVITINGTSGADVVVVGDGIITAGVGVSGTVDIDISLGGWDPSACLSSGVETTLYYNGGGGLDTFVLANVADVSPVSVTGGVVTDVTNSVTGLLAALTQFNIKRVMIENPGSTAVTIANTNLLTHASDDNEYCINSMSADSGQSVLTGLLGDFITLLVGIPVLSDILDIVDSLLGALIGPGGLIPLLPANASIIVDVAGDDRYEIYTDTSTSAIVLADLTGDDAYKLQGVGNGLVNAVVIVDTEGTDSFDVDGGLYLRLELDLAVLNTLTGLLNSPLISSLLGALTDVVNALLNCGNLLTGIICAVLQPVMSLLTSILDAVGDLFAGSPVDVGGTPASFQAGLCTPDTGQRLSWREIRS